tara:strand:- start:977 stop:3052 length:2076 start_codon:yes stop_codon:yes gene_type:complete
MAFLSEKLISASGAVGEETDPDFSLVTALFHFDGDNNGTNYNAVNSSTVSGAPTLNNRSGGQMFQGTFSPFSQDEGKWSAEFPVGVATNKLECASSADFAFGTGAFTVEAWVFVTADNYDYSRVWAIGPYYNDNNSVGLSVDDTDNSSKIAFYANAATSGRVCISTNATPRNEWFHVAVTRDGTGDFRLFVNGNLDTTNTSYRTTDISPGGNQPLVIGSTTDRAVTEPFEGFISNFRVIKGSALYTSSFTVPTSPLTAVTNTKLLTSCSNRFRDKSTSAHTITLTGLPKIQPFSPFAPSAAYDPAVNGGSAYFAIGSAQQYVSNVIPYNSSTWTVEAWVYMADINVGSTYTIPVPFHLTGTIGASVRMQFGFNSSRNLQLRWWDGSSANYCTGDDVIPFNAWHHIAISVSSNTIKMFNNGHQQSLSGTTTLNNRLSSDNDYTSWGGGIHTYSYWDGYISNLRIQNGTAQYSSSFTPPTAPVGNTSTSQVLVNYTSSNAFDSSRKVNSRMVGSCVTKTSPKKFGTGSLDIYGSTGSRLDTYSSDITYYDILNAGKFTVEFWLYVDNYHAAYSDIVGRFNGVSAGWLIYQNGSYIEAYINGVQLQVARPSTATWTHFALTRDGTTTRLFKDGTSGATSTASLGADQTSYFLAFGGDATGRNGLDGYVDEFRLTYGKARYTSNFTPATEPFPDL